MPRREWSSSGNLKRDCSIPLYSSFLPSAIGRHWYEWPLQYETFPNVISVLEAEEFLPLDVQMWFILPQCSDHSSGSEGIVMCRNTPRAQPWKARVWEWGQAMWQWNWRRYIWSLLVPQEKTPVRATLSNELSSYSWHGMGAGQTKEGKKNKNTFWPKDTTLCVFALSSASTKQILHLLKVRIFKHVLFYLYLGPKYWTGFHCLWWNLPISQLYLTQ